jgi:hypothetical protein
MKYDSFCLPPSLFAKSAIKKQKEIIRKLFFDIENLDYFTENKKSSLLRQYTYDFQMPELNFSKKYIVKNSAYRYQFYFNGQNNFTFYPDMKRSLFSSIKVFYEYQGLRHFQLFFEIPDKHSAAKRNNLEEKALILLKEYFEKKKTLVENHNKQVQEIIEYKFLEHKKIREQKEGI